jgi:hypothetical protein
MTDQRIDAQLASCLIPVPNGQHSRSIFGVLE